MTRKNEIKRTTEGEGRREKERTRKETKRNQEARDQREKGVKGNVRKGGRGK